LSIDQEAAMTQAVRDIMSKDVECANPETTLKDAATTMKNRDFGSMPVCEGRRVVGVITDRDIAIRGVAEGRDPGSTRVRDVMSKDVVSVREDSDLKEAERLMRERQLRRLPVLNGSGDLVGYLAIAKIARTESPEEAGKVLQGVSQPAKTN
jgi:CBS domain-containing protein